MSMTERWSDFLSAAKYNDLPAEVVSQTKMFILDNIGNALGGYAIKWGKKVVALGRDLGGKPEATVAGSGDRLHIAHAAYVNGKLANVLDSDETLYNNRHIGGVPFFPALSVGERVKATGRNIILATALGYDFGARCALCGSAFRPDKEKGITIGGNAAMGFNTFAAAVAAAKVFGFNKEQTANNLGIAAYFCPGAIESKFVYTPPSNFNKYGDMGWFCLGGVMSTLCAQNDFAGDPSILDGPRGLAAVLGAPQFDEETFMADMGERWYIMDAGIKPYPLCRWFHTGIKLLEDIIKEHALKPNDIGRIMVKTHPASLNLPTFAAADQWGESGRELWLAVDSITYVMALTVYGITPGPEWGKEETLNDPRIVAMTKKIIHEEHPEAMKMTASWTGHPGRLFSQPPTRIEVITEKGTFTAESTDIPGDSWNPRAKLTDEEIITKFRNNATEVVGEVGVRRVIVAVDKLEKMKDISELAKLMAP